MQYDLSNLPEHLHPTPVNVWFACTGHSPRNTCTYGLQEANKNRKAAGEAELAYTQTMNNGNIVNTCYKGGTNGDQGCRCNYHWGGCTIENTAPSGFACNCIKPIWWTCYGGVFQCDKSEPLCKNPDKSRAACQLGGQGRDSDCGGY